MNAHTMPIRRDTVAEIVAKRDKALALYEEGHVALLAAREAIQTASAMAATAAAGVNRYNWHQRDEKSAFLKAITPPDRDTFMAEARRMVDTDVWGHLIQLTGLETLMDKTAKDQFHQQLIADPPEINEGNVWATLEQCLLDADTIFKRGIATVFSTLDRRFRSHDGWKIGSRIILTHALSEWGGWSYHSNQRDAIIDIDRIFCLLDNVPFNGYGLIAAIERDRQGGWGQARQSVTETTYFKACCYKNGNVHIWFRRDDLLERVNQLLGEYYGAPIPQEREAEAEDDGDLFTPKTTPAKRYGFFPTPDAASERVIELSALYREKAGSPLRVLEPSAGTGNLALRAAHHRTTVRPRWDGPEDSWRTCMVDCVEIQPELAQALRQTQAYRDVKCLDFLTLKPDPDRLYDRVIMNPPFDRERDIDHVMHALGFLKPEGKLIAIMSAGTEFRETRKATAFRELMRKMNAQWEDLPPGSFSSVGTNCNTIILTVYKDGRRFYR